MDYSCVIVAAGSGSRTGLTYNKVFHKIDNKTVIEHSVANFNKDKDCKQIVIVVNLKELNIFKNLKLGNKVEFIEGGASRQDSVYSGLKKVNQDYVMIHDGARPYISKETIEAVKLSLEEYDASLVMVKSIDTIKIVKDNIVTDTPDRKTLYNAQTPQAFKTSLITQCYKDLYAKKLTVTDDAQAVEIMSDKKIYVVKGNYNNIKITTTEDLA